MASGFAAENSGKSTGKEITENIYDVKFHVRTNPKLSRRRSFPPLFASPATTQRASSVAVENNSNGATKRQRSASQAATDSLCRFYCGPCSALNILGPKSSGPKWEYRRKASHAAAARPQARQRWHIAASRSSSRLHLCCLVSQWRLLKHAVAVPSSPSVSV